MLSFFWRLTSHNVSPLLLPYPYWCVFVRCVGCHARFQSAVRTVFFFLNLPCHVTAISPVLTWRLAYVTGVTSNSLPSVAVHLTFASFSSVYDISEIKLFVFFFFWRFSWLRLLCWRCCHVSYVDVTFRNTLVVMCIVYLDT